jgi:hypothetical protein
MSDNKPEASAIGALDKEARLLWREVGRMTRTPRAPTPPHVWIKPSSKRS